MVGLFDSSVLIDILRGYSPSVTWFQTQPDLYLTPITYMELVAGATNKADQAKALRFLAKFNIVYLTTDDMQWAMQQHTDYALSHNLGVFDCLIAAPNYRLNLPLYTTNLKHFTPILGQLAQKPY
jgi:predicted nucleic acid-binding protein